MTSQIQIFKSKEHGKVRGYADDNGTVFINVTDIAHGLGFINKSIPGGHSIYTISFIDEVLKNVNLNPDDIDKILVINGPGSFTGLRIMLSPQ